MSSGRWTRFGSDFLLIRAEEGDMSGGIGGGCRRIVRKR